MHRPRYPNEPPLPPEPPGAPPSPPPPLKRPEPPLKENDFDERHERIEILLDVMGSYQSLTNELTADPPNYEEIFNSIDDLVSTLLSAEERLIKIKEVAEHGKSVSPHTDSDS